MAKGQGSFFRFDKDRVVVDVVTVAIGGEIAGHGKIFATLLYNAVLGIVPCLVGRPMVETIAEDARLGGGDVVAVKVKGGELVEVDPGDLWSGEERGVFGVGRWCG